MSFIVDSVVGGNTPRPATEISYNIWIREPGKPSVFVEDVVPSGPRWPDSQNTVPYKPGQRGAAWRIGDTYEIDMHELPELDECPPGEEP